MSNSTHGSASGSSNGSSSNDSTTPEHPPNPQHYHKPRNHCLPFHFRLHGPRGHHSNDTDPQTQFPYILPMNKNLTVDTPHSLSPVPQPTPRARSPATPLALQPQQTTEEPWELLQTNSRYSIGLDVPGAVQTRQPKDTSEHHSDTKLVVVMVGLPARGKSYVVKKLRRYLNWLQYETKIFNVGNRRRSTALATEQRTGAHVEHSFSFFDPSNAQAKNVRDQLAMETLEELIDWLNNKGGRVAVHDATNSTFERRRMILERMQKEPTIKVLFLESICNDKNVLERNMRLKLSGPDYKNKDPEEALRDFKQRVANYEQAYEPIGDVEESLDVQYCKLINVGKKVIAYNINGYLSGQCVFYLMNFNLAERQIFLTRHGESEDNINGIIGGDAPLSPLGKKFGAALARFIRCQRINFIQEQSRRWRNESLSQYGHHLSVNGAIRSGATTKGNATPTGIPGNASNLSVGGKSGLSVHEEQLSQIPFTVWTSMLKRTVETVEEFDAAEYDIKHIRFLNEIYSGICEGLTYREIQEKFPGEFNARQQNKLYYRYPGMGGESYLDVIHRLQPLIIELERMTQSCLIVTHRVVMRILLGYLLDWSHDEMPHMHVPIHTVYELRPKPYGTELKKWKYLEDEDRFAEF